MYYGFDLLSYCFVHLYIIIDGGFGVRVDASVLVRAVLLPAIMDISYSPTRSDSMSNTNKARCAFSSCPLNSIKAQHAASV